MCQELDLLQYDRVRDKKLPKTVSLRPDSTVCDLAFCSGNKDTILVLSVGSQFIYIIPSFAFVGVQMRQVRVKAYADDGQEELYDLFI